MRLGSDCRQRLPAADKGRFRSPPCFRKSFTNHTVRRSSWPLPSLRRGNDSSFAEAPLSCSLPPPPPTTIAAATRPKDATFCFSLSRPVMDAHRSIGFGYVLGVPVKLQMRLNSRNWTVSSFTGTSVKSFFGPSDVHSGSSKLELCFLLFFFFFFFFFQCDESTSTYFDNRINVTEERVGGSKYRRRDSSFL